MILSSMYHTFSCRSERAFTCFLSFDLFGIALSLLAIYMSGIYYAFWCDKVREVTFYSMVFM
jgi:predicted membrane channel-forming protein YqfA (hemolysin III family)